MEIYQVKSGDSLASIARDVLGDVNHWRKIAQLNQIASPYIIQPGQQLNMPDTMVLGPVVVAREEPGPPARDVTAAGPSVADFIAGVNPYVWYVVAAAFLFIALDKKK